MTAGHGKPCTAWTPNSHPSGDHRQDQRKRTTKDVLKELIRQTVSEELERTAKNSHDRPAAQTEASAEDLNAVFDFLNSFSGITSDAAFLFPLGVWHHL